MVVGKSTSRKGGRVKKSIEMAIDWESIRYWCSEVVVRRRLQTISCDKSFGTNLHYQ